jgi:hypothetical protein
MSTFCYRYLIKVKDIRTPPPTMQVAQPSICEVNKKLKKLQVVAPAAVYILHIQSISLSRAEVKLFKCEESVASFLPTQTAAPE